VRKRSFPKPRIIVNDEQPKNQRIAREYLSNRHEAEPQGMSFSTQDHLSRTILRD